MGLKVVQLPPMTADGKTMNPQVDYSRFPTIVKDVYDLQVNQSSDVEEMGGGQYYAVKLVMDKPAGPPPFEQIKTQLAQGWTISKVAAAVSAQADQATARINAGESFAKVAADMHSPVQTVTGVDRGDRAKKVNNPDTVGHMFVSKPGETFQSATDPVHISIVHLDAIHQADPTTVNTTAAQIRERFTGSFAQDLGSVTRQAARVAMKTKTFPTAAARALGVNPAASSSASASKGKS